jgi:type II secretory ATPase GspE/PulE/Tfp pilus assembly ATPase PilB-like protein
MESLSTEAPSTLDDILKNSVLFQGADDASIDLIISTLEVVNYRKGDPIILEGEISDHVYFIKSGSVEIVKYRPEVQQVSRIATLKSGAQFSEFSVLNHANKSASAFALEETELYRMSGDSFLKIVHKVPSVGRQLVMVLAELNHKAVSHATLDYFDPTQIQYSADVPAKVPQGSWRRFGVLPLKIEGGFLLAAVKDPNKSEFFDHMKATQPNLHINVVLIGENDFELTHKKLTSLYGGGEVHQSSHSTPPTSETSGDVVDCLRQSSYFRGINESGLKQVAAICESVEFKIGEIIFKPGDASEYFYIVQRGHVELSRPGKGTRVWSNLLNRDARDGISEVSLLLGNPHSRLARATVVSQLFRIERVRFMQLLSSGTFCVNLSKILAKRLQEASDVAGLRFFDVHRKIAVAELSHLVPKQVMQQNQIIPLVLEDDEITLGVVNPGNEAVYSIALRYLRDYRIRLEMISLELFNAWLGQAAAAQAKTAGVQAAAGISTSVTASMSASRKTATGANTVLELNKLLHDGYDSRASDLHLEPAANGYCVRYRVDGVLTEVASRIPVEAGEAIINRIKVVSQMDISNHMTPQDGQLKIVEGTTEMTARVVTIPTKQGEGAVLRLIRNRSGTVPLSVLAPETRAVRILKNVTKYKQGLFLVTGPTGSGKTTTLYSLVSELNRVDVKIITIEDPVELEIPGTTQIEVNEKTGLTFEKALRSTLRQDPDILVLGEIRDEQSAKVVFEAALSGHLVISTLHTNNSFAVRQRLAELGIPPGLMASGLVGSSAQRLVRQSCKKCRTSRLATDAEKALFAKVLHLSKLPEEVVEGRGCILCNYTGFHGRMPIMEIWNKTRKIEDLILRAAGTEELLAAAREDGFDTLYEFGLKMALNGLTTIEEVERVTAGGL